PRIAVWDTLLRARAIENVSYVVGANRVGEDPAGTYPGHSVVVGFRGDVLAQTSEGRTGYVTYSLSLEELLSFREKFPVLEDGDEFVLA
ncbi:MAG: nitrilase family protein, partial [Alistipes sp.]|nr:nitrilase family protein [Alistipes sp.]